MSTGSPPLQNSCQGGCGIFISPLFGEVSRFFLIKLSVVTVSRGRGTNLQSIDVYQQRHTSYVVKFPQDISPLNMGESSVNLVMILPSVASSSEQKKFSFHTSV